MRGEFVDLGGTRLYYYAAGTRGGGDPVVLLHGFPGSSHSWRELAPLMPEGRRLVVVDLMGCGRSDGPPVAGRTGARAGSPAASIAAHVALIRALMDDLAITRAALVGHGIGGAIAQAVALGHPDRVSALLLISSIAFDAWPRRLARLARLTSPAATLIGAPMLASFVHGSAIRGYTDREAGRRALDHSLRAYPAHLGCDALVAHLFAPADPAIAAYGARLGEIGVPTAVVWGEDDPFLSLTVGERLRSAIRGATLEVVPEARHFVHEEAPEVCARVAAELFER